MVLLFVTSLCFRDFCKKKTYIICFGRRNGTSPSLLLTSLLRKFIIYLYQQMHNYIKILNYVKNASTCFGASALSSRRYNFSKRNIKAP
jgi:hypothetical protein